MAAPSYPPPHQILPQSVLQFAGNQMVFPGFQPSIPQQQKLPIRLPPDAVVPEICPWLEYCDHYVLCKGWIKFSAYAEQFEQEGYYHIDQFVDSGVEEIACWSGIKPAIVDLLKQSTKEDMHLLAAGHFTMD